MVSPTDYNPSVFHREMQKNYGIVPQWPMDLLTEYNPSVFHKELQKNYGIVPHSPTSLPTKLPTYNTDGITDGLTHITKRMHVWHVSVCTNTDGITDGFTHIPKRTHVWHVSVCTNTDRSKSLAGFSNFFLRISINFRRNYRRNLMPPTTINFRR